MGPLDAAGLLAAVLDLDGRITRTPSCAAPPTPSRPARRPGVPDEELARLATLVLDAMGTTADALPPRHPRDARRLLSVWGILRRAGAAPEAAKAAAAECARTTALPDRQLLELVAAVRAARALLR